MQQERGARCAAKEDALQQYSMFPSRKNLAVMFSRVLGDKRGAVGEGRAGGRRRARSRRRLPYATPLSCKEHPRRQPQKGGGIEAIESIPSGPPFAAIESIQFESRPAQCRGGPTRGRSGSPPAPPRSPPPVRARSAPRLLEQLAPEREREREAGGVARGGGEGAEPRRRVGDGVFF
jgi:hypothetical protein